MAAGVTRTAIATLGDDVVAMGQHQPVGDVTEIVGVATVPRGAPARHRGRADRDAGG